MNSVIFQDVSGYYVEFIAEIPKIIIYINRSIAIIWNDILL